jgi:glycyl-tRNA synthetase beta chain
MFGIGQIPTGDRDPFALRRHALGVIRMLAEGDLDLPLDNCCKPRPQPFAAVDGFQAAEARLPISSTTASPAACASRATRRRKSMPSSQRPQRLGDIPKRLAAVRAFSALPEAAALAAANKRVGNILKKVDSGRSLGQKLTRRCSGSGRNRPARALVDVVPQADSAFAAGDYTGSLQAWPPCASRSTASSTTSWSMPKTRPCAPTGSACWPPCTLAMNQVADISKLSA